MHKKLANNNHQTRCIREKTMMQTPAIGHETCSNALSVEQGNAGTFKSDAARHSRNKYPETKPDCILVTQNIESRSVNVINHAALYELTS
jgi:hypothetical protein